METVQLLRQWFDSRQDYQQGLALAKAHGIDAMQLKLLESGQNTLTSRKLRTFLQGLLDQLSAQANTPTVHVALKPDPAPVATAPAEAAPDPPEVQELKARRVATFKQAQHHQGQMRATPPGRERFEHARRIKQLFRENDLLFSQEAYFKKFGFLPKPAVTTLDRGKPLDVLRRRNTLRTYVTGANKGTRGKSDPTKLAAWSAELLELDLILAHGQPL